MLYNLNWLSAGKQFPPLTELGRLKGYKDNARLFEEEPSHVLKPYEERFFKIINSLKDSDGFRDSFYVPENYWQLSTIKTMDLMIGDEPNITCDKAKDDLSTILLSTNFHNKLNELVIDNDSMGECLLRPYINKDGERDFVAQSPMLWFPVCNSENIKEVLTDVLCWTECVYQDANMPSKNKYELHCKIQDRSSNKVIIRRYDLPKNIYYSNFIHPSSKENFGEWTFFTIGKMIEEKVEDAVYSQLVIQIPGVTTSRSLHGISNYDRITALVAELAIRKCLANFILDQNSAPRLAAPDSAFVKNKEGKYVLKTGGRNFVVAPGNQVPVYITWDGSLQANEARITDLKNTLFSMCEVGPVINQEELNSSQGYEALNVKLTNAKAKVRRMAKNFKQPLKKLVAFLLGKDDVKDKDINIIFNEGIPVSEYQNIITAQAKKNLGFSGKSIFVEYFGLTEEEAEAEIERAKEENASSFIEAFGINKNNDFKDENNNPNNEVNPPTTEPTNGDNAPIGGNE